LDREQVFRGRRARRFANHPILESEAAYEVEENLSLSPNLGSYNFSTSASKVSAPVARPGTSSLEATHTAASSSHSALM
jgi:hypothetical protein